MNFRKTLLNVLVELVHATSSRLALLQWSGACTVLYQLPDLRGQGPKSVNTASIHYVVLKPVLVYCYSWEEGVLFLHGVAVGHGVA